MSKLPSNWQVKPLGEVAVFINGRAFKPEEWGTKGLPIIRIQNLTGFSSIYNYFDGNVNDKNLVRKNDILISWSASLGVYIWDRDDAVLNQHIFKVELKKDIDRLFFFYLVKTKIDEMISNVHGSTMKHITKGRFDNIKVKIPPLPIQKQIAEILEKADQAKQKRKEANKLTDKFLQSVFIEMFGDPVKNPKGFKVVTIGDVISEVRDGPHVSPNYVNNGIPILSTRNVRPGLLLLDDIKYVSEEHYNYLTRNFKPRKEDVLLTKGGTTGYAKVVDFEWPFCVWVHIAVLRPKSIIHPQYLESALNSDYCYKQSQLYTHGIANHDLGLTRIIKIKLLLPPFELQQQFAEIVNKTEALKEKQKQSEQELENLFQSLMQKAFKGELVC